ncbi:hypothetical protein NDS46_30890 (plasmid) [Paenibacillus thiaminolyticus]|uniref:hypothetical protein n=1 Tax=Paenibacillus thiaminolyticus TaxID=49283 RepID=UPI00232D315F|nr:hypothetical protein [Paenibacillus thiaminolyticus]WCF11754.1 hypothetical protein NDS46_30890 [Paenibacillus thiaminolyticus]
MQGIGKMYRPTKIYSLHDKRGLKFHHKYKSNFGGIFEFVQDVYLHFNEEDRETIQIEIKDLKIDVLLDVSYFTLASNQVAYSKKEKRAVSSLRDILRPGDKKMSSKSNSLSGEMIVHSEREKSETESLIFDIKPVLFENKEYLLIIVEAKTQIEIAVDTKIKLIKR